MLASEVIMVDSGSDLTREYIERHVLKFIPMSYSFGDEFFPDDMGQTDPIPDFYKKVREGLMPTTSQIRVSDFEETMAPILAGGKDILYICFSSALSGTCQAALVAKKNLEEQYPGRRVLVVDSASASMGDGLLIDYAVRLFEEGKNIDQVAQWIEENKKNLQHWFTVDDLNHLHRGGRVSGAAAFFGTLLDIKPVLHVDEQGRLIPIDKIKGRKRALRALVDRMEQLGENLSGQRVFISHGDALKDAEYVADLIRERFGTTDITIGYIGPIIGAHSGPGTVALFFMGKNRQAFL